MDKELKKEIIIKGIKKMKDEKHLDFLFGFIIAHNRKEINKNKNNYEG